MSSSSCLIKVLSALLLCSIAISMVLIQILFTESPTVVHNQDLNAHLVLGTYEDNSTSTSASCSSEPGNSDGITFDFIFGYSSSGKSTYVNQTYGNDATLGYFKLFGFQPQMTERERFLRFDKWIKNATEPGNPRHRIVIHANIFLISQNQEKYTNFFRTMLNYPAVIRATGLVTNPESLITNMQNRKTVEGGKGKYSTVKDIVLNIAKDIDQAGFFRFFVEEFLLPNNDIELSYIESKPNFRFQTLPDLESAISVLSSRVASKSEVQKFYDTLGKLHSHHRVRLPFNLTIEGGIDYEESKNIIFDNVNVVRKSILDINSPFGYFALEASRAGATVARAFEGHRHLELGVALKQLWGVKNLEILPLDIYEPRWRTPFVQNRYDVVFLMNTIHRTYDPVRLLRIASSLAKDALVVELPPPKHKFVVSDTDPVITHVKQVFGLNAAVVESVLLSDCKSFKKIVSPLPNRIIMICFKTKS